MTTQTPEDDEIRDRPDFPSAEEMRQRLIDRELPELAATYEKVAAIAEAVKTRGGRALLVGGSVRDHLFGKVSKDFDLEIYGLEPEVIEEVVTAFGKVKDAGKAFGILKVIAGEGIDIDVSLPRSDSKVSEGHTGFAIKADPHMSIEEAARRRDFTMNSLAADPITGEVFDYFGGVQDIQDRVLRVTDAERFQDDPLRIMRALQFIGRFGLRLDEQSAALIREMTPSLRELPKERIYEEWKKLLLKSPKPSLGLAAGMTLGVWHELHAELPPLAETPQEPEWHPEGDVWVHTMMVVDAAAEVIEREQLDEKTATTVMIGALVHDLGKPSTTSYSDGRWRSPGHEAAGVEPALRFMERLGVENLVKDKVARITDEHLTPSMFYISEVVRPMIARIEGKSEAEIAQVKKRGQVSDGAIRKLAGRLHPATIQELVYVAESDHAGRGPFMDPEVPEQMLLPDGFPAGPWLLERARRIAVEQSRPADVLQGRQLIQAGYKPGREFGTIITLANRLRDELSWPADQIRQVVCSHGSAAEVIPILERLLDQPETTE